MKKTFKVLITIVCIIAGAASFLYLCMRDRDTLGEYYAQSSISVEIETQFAHNIAVAIETAPNPCSYWMSPTTAVNIGQKTVIMHKSIPLKRIFWNPAIQFPFENAQASLEAIDNVAFFVGNKLFYFSHHEVQQFRREDKDDYAFFYLPGIYYKRSIVFKNWSNYYGDINFGIIALTAFLLYPARFVPVYLLLGLLLFMYRKQAAVLYATAMNNKKITGIILFIIIVATGFVLRWNGYVRHSGWTDEIYSAVQTGNPTLPFISTFTDPGNPPFYFILLRFWFKLFGWSEESGTMLSVLLGTISIITLYLPVRCFLGRKTALCAALFVALSGFSIGYSREMRGYILEMALAPLITFALFNFIKKPSMKNIALYVLPSIMIVNTHFYGIIFIMANFLFFITLTLYQRQWQWRKAFVFTAGNVIIALSFLPYFLYMLFVKEYNFIREYRLGLGHSLVFFVLLLFIAAFFVFRKEITGKYIEKIMPENNQKSFTAYLLLTPAFIFMLAYVISFIRPMIAFRYLWPINAPFCFALAATGIFLIYRVQKSYLPTIILTYIFVVSLHGITPDIPGGGIEGYKEARAYIAADASAHPERKAAILDNAPANAAYYGYPILPSYAESTKVDVLYVYNDIFTMHEIDMYSELRKHNINEDSMLKVYFDFKYRLGDGNVIFKYYLKSEHE